MDAVDAAGLRDREEVEKWGVPMRTSPGPIVFCLSASQTGPYLPAVPLGSLTLSLEEEVLQILAIGSTPCPGGLSF